MEEKNCFREFSLLTSFALLGTLYSDDVALIIFPSVALCNLRVQGRFTMSSPTAQITVRGACPHDCPDTCSMLITVEDGRAVAVRGNPDHPFTRGGLCVKVNNYTERVYSPDRVLYPLRRTGPKGSKQ